MSSFSGQGVLLRVHLPFVVGEGEGAAVAGWISALSVPKGSACLARQRWCWRKGPGSVPGPEARPSVCGQHRLAEGRGPAGKTQPLGLLSGAVSKSGRAAWQGGKSFLQSCKKLRK